MSISWLVSEFPVVEYEKAWNMQVQLVHLRKDNIIDKDIILFLEHFPVFTLGKRGTKKNLIVSEEFLEKSKIKVIQIERGGDITYHGPGQLVVYPLINLEKNKTGVKDYVFKLEEIMIKTVSDFGIKAHRSNIGPGIWVKNRKIGSIGIGVRKGISFHGLALNVNLCIEPFKWINPCGFKQLSMTSVKNELKDSNITINQTKKRMQTHIQDVFNIKLVLSDNLMDIINDLHKNKIKA